ncbi:MAG: protein kinase [Gammaproteobacteria bacterium]|nr:protein kinase [Gammaproteobacteria bacterium]
MRELANPRMPPEDDPNLLNLAESVADGRDVTGEAGSDAPSDNLRRLAALAGVFSRFRESAPEPPFSWAGLEVESVVGQGGFGTVYRARDPVLARYVALKLIDRGALDDDEFMGEARRLARVRHPNVLSVHGVEQAEGLVGLWADLLEGETLEELLARGPVDRTSLLAIAAQLAEALRAVHAAGLVHGDIKAGNVMIDADGHVTLMDFGAAHQAVGGLLRFGSPRNMAPECFDAPSGLFAADVYAFGALLYRMAAGRHAWADLDRERLVARKRGGELDLKPLGGLPRRLRSLITAMLAPTPDARPDMAGIVRRIEWLRSAPVRRLRRAAAVAAALCLAMLAAWMVDRNDLTPESGSSFEASVAVMPFDDLDADKEHGDFVRGLSDEILHALSGVGGLKVIGRYSAYAAVDGERSEAAKKLGVDHLLHGSVRRSGDRLRVYAELTRSEDGAQVWSETFDRRLDDVFRIQDSIAAEVARALRGVTIDDDRSDVRRTDVDLYEIYLRGLSLLNRRGVDNLLRSIEYFRDVVDRDPRFAPAWSGLSSAYAVLPSYMNAPADSVEKALKAARRAIELDPDDGLALGVLATQHTVDREWLQAERMHQRSLAASPSSSVLQMWYGELMAETGRLIAKRERMALAVELDPLAPAQRGNYGWALIVNGDFAGGRRECLRAWNLGLEAIFVWQCTYYSLLFSERFDEARSWIERVPRGATYRQQVRLFQAAYRDPYNADKHQRALDALEEAREHGIAHWESAAWLSMLGETESARQVIEEAVASGDLELVRSLFGPHFTALQGEDRFVDLMHRLGMVEYWRATEWSPLCRPVGGQVECAPIVDGWRRSEGES